MAALGKWFTMMLRDAHMPTEPAQPTTVGVLIQQGSIRPVGLLFPDYVGALSVNLVENGMVTKWSVDVLSDSDMLTLKTKGVLKNGNNEYRLIPA